MYIEFLRSRENGSSDRLDGGMSVEISWRLVESSWGSCGFHFASGDLSVGRAGTGFAWFARSKEDGSGGGQNLSRRRACAATASSFYSAGLIGGKGVSRHAKPGADREGGAGV